MSIQMTKTWFVDVKIIEKKIPESEIYARPWNIEECKAYAAQLRDKNRANTAEHAAEAIEYLLSALQEIDRSQRPWVGLTPEEILNMFDEHNVYGSKWVEFARAIEAKLRSKNT